MSLAACSDSTAPVPPDVTVIVSLTQVTAPTISGFPGEESIECQISLRATAQGDGRATWNDATLLFYAGPDRTTAVDSIPISKADIQSSWSSADIGVGETQESGWRVSAGIPFGAALVYRYKVPSGEVRSTRITFTCGPEIPANPAPPTITAVTVTPAGDEIEPGDTIVVHYTAASTIGLWTSTLRMSGACTVEQSFSERLLTTSEHTVLIVVPPGCALGRLLTFSVFAADAVFESVTVPALRSFAVVDRTPPHVIVDYMPDPTKYYFVGDTLHPFVWGNDNNSVSWVIWEIQPAGIRDSISGAGGRFLDIPIPPQWAGTNIQLRFFARDGVGLVSDTARGPAAGLPIYPTVQPAMHWGTISGDVMNLAVDEKRGALYLLQGNGGWRVGGVRTSDIALTESIPLPAMAWDLDMSAGGDSLILALPDLRALGIIDLRESPRRVQLLPIRSLDTTTQQAPWQVRVGANGKAYVILEGAPPAQAVLLEVELATGVERVVPGAGNIQDARFERSFDGSALIFEKGTDLFERYDVAAETFTAFGTPRSIYGPLRVDDNGSRVTVGLFVYDGDLQFERRVAAVLGGEAMSGSALTKDGAYLFHILGNRGVARTRTNDGAVVDRFLTPFPASEFLRVTPDGNTLIVVDSFVGTSRIALVDLR